MAKKPIPANKIAAKPAAKTKSSSGKKDAVREKLLKELKTIIPKLDSEGLVFLVEQSRIHLYNMQVENLNNARIATAAHSKTNSTKTSKAKPVKEAFIFDATSAGFCLRYGTVNTMFSKQEMTALVKIANGSGSDLEISGRIFTWFERERSDVIGTLRLTDRFDDRIKLLAVCIKKNFRLRDS